ncbi:shikimate 5-dehydrogenase [Pseudorhodoferax sp. LjRoot39]|uniref:shikimate 5-dehydrogenase n=1 Tax=Pseudorhodoferax sp. LjRoot39 TaxID=3342328 RepID=UPI003ECDEB52
MNMDISRDTQLCMSLSGRPGNFGTRFHNHLYRALGLDYVYKAFTTTDLPAAIGGVRALGIRGCAVSMPFKEACIPLLDELQPSAARLQSVNTIVNEGGRLIAHNTDYVAVAALLETHAVDPASRFVLRGSGGMGRAVLAALVDHGLGGCVVARNAQAGPAVAALHGLAWQGELGDAHQAEGAWLVNVTPLGMAGAQADAQAFPDDWIARAAGVFDVVALPAETPLLRAARRLGRPVIGGDEVIVLQAVEQFVLYTGVRPDAAQIAAAAAHARAV